MSSSQTVTGYARDFRELVVYQRQRELAREVFARSKRFPREEAYSLTDQPRRSSRSIGAQIAEAWAKRRYQPHFTSKLTDADAEQRETQHWIETATDCSYLTHDESTHLLSLCSQIGRMLGAMISRADEFCTEHSGRTREEPAEFFCPALSSATANC